MGYQEEKQRQLDLRYLRMAAIWAENSYCVRRKVGALIVKDKMIISDGYNGTPSGFENICEDETGRTKPYVLHAEANAITKVAKSANNCDGSTLYITAAPCIECSKLIIQAGIRRVVYSDDYRSEEGLDLLRRVGIECVQYRLDRDLGITIPGVPNVVNDFKDERAPIALAPLSAPIDPAPMVINRSPSPSLKLSLKCLSLRALASARRWANLRPRRC